MSSLPDVFSLVRIRSKFLLVAIASAAALSEACCSAHKPGSKIRRSCSSIRRITFHQQRGANRDRPYGDVWNGIHVTAVAQT